jgi:ketosteroid isomerase-like protein
VVSNLAVAEKAVAAIAAGDADALAALLADDAVFEFPYANGRPSYDKAGALGVIGFLIRTFPMRRFSVDRVFELADPDGLVIEYSSDFGAGAVRYANHYVAILRFRAGLVTLWREYANPVPFERAVAALRRSS